MLGKLSTKLGIDWPQESKDLLRKEVRKNRVRKSNTDEVQQRKKVYEGRFPERFTGFQDPPVPARCSTKISTKYKMVKIKVESFSEEELRKRWNELVRKESWDETCEKWKMPVMLHKGPSTRSAEGSEAELPDLWKAWEMYKEKMKPIRK